MKKLAFNAMFALFACASGMALAQQNVNIRGTVRAFDGAVVSVDAKSGGTVEVALPENLAVSGTRAITLADIQPGMPLGVTTIKRADGETVAIDIRPIPPTAPMDFHPSTCNLARP